MAGLFFCLASAEGAGLLFCHFAIQPHASVYSVFCAVNAIYTTNATKHRTGLYKRFSCNLPHSTAYNTRPTQAAIIPPVPRWSVSQRRNTSSTYQIQAPHRDAIQVSAAAYYNNVYTGAAVRPLLWIHARRCSISQTMPARRGSVPTVCGLLTSADTLSAAQARRTESTRHFPPGGAVRQQERGGRRGTIDGYCRISFRAFAR